MRISRRYESRIISELGGTTALFYLFLKIIRRYSFLRFEECFLKNVLE